MASWIIKEKINAISDNISISLHQTVVKLLLSRGFSTQKQIQQFIFPEYEKDLISPFLFGDMEKVVERIRAARERKEHVVIYGDYDADGITASIVLKESLDKLGIESFVYIPDKLSEGYGINIQALEDFKKKNVSLIITVDCGITNVEEIDKANALGIDVIVTDHHHVPDALPKAYAIINPHYKDCKYPFQDLAGVGVAFKVAQALHERLLDGKIEQTKWLLDLVAIGTIADCVPLIGENRLFVKFGLIVLSKTRRAGLKEMFSAGRIQIDENNLPDTKKVAFYVAPRINAAGRIKHAGLAYRLIFEKDRVKARSYALEIEEHNSYRQKVTDNVVSEVRILAQNMFKNKKFIYAMNEHFPVGVIGLAAGKIAQEFARPVAIFSQAGEKCVGSFRSIPKVNIIEMIEQCKDHLMKFGGHSQAAGVTLSKDELEMFCKKMANLIEQKLEGIELSEDIMVDCEIDPQEIDFQLAQDIGKLEPFGQGNQEPLFLVKNLTVRDTRIVGNGNKHIKLFVSADGKPSMFESISFNGYEKFSNVKIGDKIDMVCNIKIDEWNGNKKVQLTLIDLKIQEANSQS